jgi:Zn-dependent protease with chaperone function
VETLAQVSIGNAFNSPIGVSIGLGNLVSIILSNAVAIAGLVLVFLMVFGGIMVISGAGADNPERAAKGKQAVTAAIIGFIIIFVSYWIVQIIEIATGVQILNPGL